MWHEDDLHQPQPHWSNHHCCTRFHHHLNHYENNGIETHTTENGFIGVDHYKNHMYYPVSYVMVNDDVQEQEHHHHHTFSQMLMSCRPPPPPTPEPSSLQPLMSSSPPLPDSYYVHQPFTPMMQQPQQPSLLSSSQESLLTVGCNTIQQHIQQRINDNDCNERNSTRIIKNDLSSSCFRRLHLGERTIDNSMNSTVIFDKNTQRRTSNNNNRLLEQANEIKTKFEITLDDDKVVNVCKRTILAAINKIIVDNYESALYKLRKTIRILDILIFNEGVSGIGIAKIDTVRPWLETLKDMERKCIQNQQDQHNINGDHGPNQLEDGSITRTEDNFHKQLRQLSSNKSGKNNTINNESSKSLYHFWWKSNLRRYRTTGKFIVEQRRCKTIRRRHQRNKQYS